MKRHFLRILGALFFAAALALVALACDRQDAAASGVFQKPPKPMPTPCVPVDKDDHRCDPKQLPTPMPTPTPTPPVAGRE